MKVPEVPDESGELTLEERFELEVQHAARAERVRRRALELVNEEDDDESTEPLRVHSLAELRRLQEPEALWDGWLYQGSPAIMSARGGVGKSALALGLACAMYHGVPYLGSEVRRGRALYIAGEGHRSIAKRIEAWERYHHVKLRSTRIGVIYDMTLTADTLSHLAATVEEGRYDLVIADTVSALARLDNESDNVAVARFVRRFQRAVFQGNPDASPLLVHHVTTTIDALGRSRQKTRGASAFRDDNDTVILLEGISHDFTMTTDQSRGGKQSEHEERTLPGLALQKVFLSGGRDAAVVIQQTPIEVSGHAAEVRHLVDLMELGEGYTSTALQALWGMAKNKTRYQRLRTAALDQGLIKKGPSNKDPYLRTEAAK